LEKIEIPGSKYAIFKINSKHGPEINAFVKNVYTNYIPYSDYNIKNSPEVEVHYETYIEWWLPIIPKTDN